MFGDLYSMEADNDEIDVCMKSQVNDETAVTEAGTDTEATDVSNIDTKTEAHNELASTGGVATGSDTADMEMDPVAATEAYCFKTFSLSAEDMANEIESCVEEVENASDNEPEDNSYDPELEAVGMNNAGISTDDPAKVIPDETPADNAGITPDADESKYNGEEDADAPTNPIPPALPTSEENWECSEEQMNTIRAEIARSLEAEYSTEENKVLSKAEGFNIGVKSASIGDYISTLIKAFKLTKILGGNAPLMLAKALGKSAVATSANLVLITLFDNLISCGTFEDGTDVLKSPKCLSKILAFKNKHKNNTLTANELKKIPEARSKSGFLKWALLEQASGKKINDLDKVDVAIREVEGVPVSIVKLTPFAGSVDLKQLAGYRVIIVTGYYRDDTGKVHSKHLCQAYITKGAKVNKSGEALSRESAPYTDFI